MKKVTSLLLLAGVAAFGLVGCGDDVTGPGSVTGVTVSPESITIEIGETATLSANVEGAGDTGVTWSSSNPSIASVDGDGNVTGQSTGSTTVLATSTANPDQSGAAEVTVTEVGGDRPTISILGIECDDSIADCSEPDNIEGDLDVTVNVDEGGADIASVQLLLNGEVVREQTFSTAIAGLSQQTQGTSNITFELDTDGAGECTMGEVLTPNISNGLKELQARLILEEGDDETATWDDSLNFDNENRIEVVHVEGTGATAVGGGAANNSNAPEGQRFWGHDFMSMATVNDTLTFAACPVVFEGDITVDEIRLAGATNSSGDPKDFDVDLGSGHGAQQADDAEPFQYLADPAANDSVEDTDGGHVIGTDVQVFDDEGEDVTSSFDVVTLSDFWLDFTAPMEEEPGTGAIQIDEMAILMQHYSDETADYLELPDGTLLTPVLLDGDPDGDGNPSDYNVVGVVDNGVGVVLDDQPVDVYHDTAADIGGASAPVAADVEGLNDTDDADAFVLDEQGPDTDPDWYVANVPELIDILKNSMSTAGIPGLESSTLHGVDRTEPTITAVDTIPEGKIIDDTVPFITFLADDPALNNDADPVDPGSGVRDEGCEVDGGCEWVIATVGDTLVLPVDSGAANTTAGAFDISLEGQLDEGETNITLFVPDSAVKAPNVATLEYSFIWDTTPPTVGFAGVTGLNSSDADEVTFTVDGSVVDRNGDGTAVDSAIIFVTVTTTNATCNDADDVDPDDRTPPAPIEPDTVSVVDSIRANGGDYSQEFVAQNTGTAMDEVMYCFNMRADDGAMSTDMTVMDPHALVRSATKTFTWNP